MKIIEFTTYVNLQDRSWFQWKNVLWPILKSDGIWLQQHPGPIQLIHNSTIAYVAMIHPRGEYVAGFQTALNTNLEKYVSEHKEEVTTLLTQYRILWKDELPDIQVSMPRSKEVKRSINSV